MEPSFKDNNNTKMLTIETICCKLAAFPSHSDEDMSFRHLFSGFNCYRPRYLKKEPETRGFFANVDRRKIPSGPICVLEKKKKKRTILRTYLSQYSKLFYFLL